MESLQLLLSIIYLKSMYIWWKKLLIQSKILRQHIFLLFFFTQVNQEVCVPQNELLDRCMRKTQQGKQACVPWLKSVWWSQTEWKRENIDTHMREREGGTWCVIWTIVSCILFWMLGHGCLWEAGIFCNLVDPWFYFTHFYMGLVVPLQFLLSLPYNCSTSLWRAKLN
jgi:hypothetical protein